MHWADVISQLSCLKSSLAAIWKNYFTSCADKKREYSVTLHLKTCINNNYYPLNE